ncbi:MAG: hypothetical protein NT140_08740 [Deltaproteobacteria bacterium]|nr:hypothetical protein [Deltaproteobacteria bacterium]
MRIRVRLFGLLAIHSGDDDKSILELEVSQGTAYQDVAAKLNLPAGGAFMFGVDIEETCRVRAGWRRGTDIYASGRGMNQK